MDLQEFLKQCLADGKDMTKAQTEIKDFVEKNYVGKGKFDELTTAKSELDKQIKERDKQLDDLKKNAGNKEALEQQIADLKAANKKAAEDYEQKIKDTKLDAAIKIAIGNHAQDIDIVAGLIDRTKLILGDDGEVTGLDEQVKALQTNKAFLFKPAPGSNPYKPNGGSDPVKNPFAKETFNLTEQGKLYRENPEQARALAAAAGVTI